MKKYVTDDDSICCGNCKHFSFVVSSANKKKSYGFCTVGPEPENTSAEFRCKRRFEE